MGVWMFVTLSRKNYYEFLFKPAVNQRTNIVHKKIYTVDSNFSSP